MLTREGRKQNTTSSPEAPQSSSAPGMVAVLTSPSVNSLECLRTWCRVGIPSHARVSVHGSSSLHCRSSKGEASTKSPFSVNPECTEVTCGIKTSPAHSIKECYSLQGGTAWDSKQLWFSTETQEERRCGACLEEPCCLHQNALPICRVGASAFLTPELKWYIISV